MREPTQSTKVRWMCAMWVVTCLIATFRTEYARCTTHFVYYDGSVVWIASDSLRTIPNGPSRSVCKLLGNADLVLLAWGKVGFRGETTAGIGTGKELVPFQEQAAKILNGHGTRLEKIAELKKLSQDSLFQILNYMDPTGLYNQTDSFFLNWVVIWFDQGIPYEQEIDFDATRRGSHVPTVNSLKPTRIPDNTILQFAVQTQRPPSDSGAKAPNTALYLHHLLDLASAEVPMLIGKPYSIARLSPGRFDRIEGADLCKGYSKK